jgi:hypothetical protein
MERRRFSGLMLAALGSMISTPAFARRGRRFTLGGGMVGSRNYSVGTLTVEELEVCVKAERQIEAYESRIDGSELEKLQRQLDDLSREVNLSASTVDNFSQASVDSHNALVDEYNSTLEKARALQADYNSSVDSLNFLVDDFNLKCANKRYYDADMQTVIDRIGP